MKFDFVKFGEIPDLAQSHPLIFEKFGSDQGKLLSDNPYIDDEFPYLFYMHEDNKLACYFYSFPDRMKCDDQIFPWAWNGDLFTDPDFRGQGLATKLVSQQVAVQHELGYGWGGVFSTEAAIRLYQKLNFSLPGYAERYLYLRSLTPLLREHVKSRGLVAVANGLYQAGRFVIEPVLKSTGSKITVTAMEVPTCHRDRHTSLPVTNHDTKFHFDHGVDMLRWKLRADKTNRLYLLKDQATDENLCYIVLRSRNITKPIAGRYKNFEMMSLMDFGLFVDDDRPYDAIISATFNLFENSTAELLDIVSSNQKLNLRARRRGMRSVGKGMSYKFSAPDSWNLPPETMSASNWQLTHFTGDAFGFE